MAERTIDYASDVLSKLCHNITVSVEEAKHGLECYDKLERDLQFYKSFYIEAVKDGEALVPPAGKGSQPDQDSFVYRLLEKMKVEKDEVETKLKRKEEEISDLKNRLSTILGDKLTDNNPNITDLSETFRPITLAEKFRQVYDNEWTDAFEDLHRKVLDERETVDMLAEIVKRMDELCSTTEPAQMKDVYQTAMNCIFFPKTGLNKATPVANSKVKKPLPQMSRYQEERSKKQLKDFRKAMAALSIQDLLQTFDQIYLAEILKKHKLSNSIQGFNKYVQQCMRLIWLMKIQDPPMKLLWQNKGDSHDRNNFTFYKKTGGTVLCTVWPAVLLHAQGPLMSKGIVQAKAEKQLKSK